MYLPGTQYAGINAHLHSYFQQVEGWPDFHSSHITDLRRALQALLPLSSGYLVAAEQGLQIAWYDLEADASKIIRSRVDLGITRTGETNVSPDGQATTPTLTFPAMETLTEADDVRGIVIYRVLDDSQELVTRLELLSPANKPGGSHYGAYLEKREATLRSGIKLVEIDYLHERRSPISRIPDYPHGEAGSFPYSVAVSMMTDDESGLTQVFGFRVDEPIPMIAVPLADDEAIVVDFNAVYQETFRGNTLYAQLYVDYENPPRNLEAYDKIDQERIQAVMAKAV